VIDINTLRFTGIYAVVFLFDLTSSKQIQRFCTGCYGVVCRWLVRRTGSYLAWVMVMIIIPACMHYDTQVPRAKSVWYVFLSRRQVSKADMKSYSELTSLCGLLNDRHTQVSQGIWLNTGERI
jgi:hypothetical protein